MEKKGIILVLSGGGARGLSHIGVLEVLHEKKIPIMRIIGASAGAVVGASYCAGKLGKFKKLILGFNKKDIQKMFFSFPAFSALFSRKNLDSYIDTNFSNIKIENLKIPFTAVAFDILKKKKVIFEKNNLANALKASISIPLFYSPFKSKSSFLIDAISDPMPVDMAKKYKSSGRIIAVNSETHPHFAKNKFNLSRAVDAVACYELVESAKKGEKNADVVIKPEISEGHFEYYNSDSIIKSGRKAALKSLPQIRKLLRE